MNEAFKVHEKEGVYMESCWYKAITGEDRDDAFCDGFDLIACKGCPFFLSESPGKEWWGNPDE